MRIGALVQPLNGGKFWFSAVGTPASLKATVNPVPVHVAVGNDNGTTSVNATFK